MKNFKPSFILSDLQRCRSLKKISEEVDKDDSNEELSDSTEFIDDIIVSKKMQ